MTATETVSTCTPAHVHLLSKAATPPATPPRRHMPRQRSAVTTAFQVGGADGFMTTSRHEDGDLGEVFLTMAKPGSTMRGLMDALAISISIGLQYGAPLETYVHQFTGMTFEPAGLTDDHDIPRASSLMDYIARRLALDYLPADIRTQLGVLTASENGEAKDGSLTAA